MENSNHYLSRVTLLQTRTTSKSTTLLTTLNRFSLPLIPFSQDRSTFLSQGSLRCSVSIMRPCQGRSISSPTRQENVAKGQTMLSVVFTTTWRHTGLVRRWCSCMPITAPAKTRTIVWCIICHGELTDRHTSITLSFLVVGHTKFSPDWCFGLFKRHYRRTKVGSLRSLAQVVNESAECNFAQLVCDEEGRTIVPTYDWTDFFAPHLKKIQNIKKYHHFRFTSSKPGTVFVFVREHADTPGWR